MTCEDITRDHLCVGGWHRVGKRGESVTQGAGLSTVCLRSSLQAYLGFTLHIPGSEATLSLLAEFFNSMLSDRVNRACRRSPTEPEL